MNAFFLTALIDQNELNVPKQELSSSNFASVLQIVFGLAGSIALLMIMFGALKYVLSQGDSSRIAKAKDTILYAIVGLIVCVTAFAIVTFVAQWVST